MTVYLPIEFDQYQVCEHKVSLSCTVQGAPPGLLDSAGHCLQSDMDLNKIDLNNIKSQVEHCIYQIIAFKR